MNVLSAVAEKSIKSYAHLAMSMVMLSYALPAQAVITPPTLDNAAYVLMDYDTGTILAQNNADKPLPPASLTKMMTSYLIEQRLQQGKLKEDEPVLMTPEAWCRGSSEESCMYVDVNKTAPVIDMLKGIIIVSGNDAAKAMAQHIAGSETAFADLMNDEAKKIGMTHTHFVNATGMPAEEHKASARDLALLSQAIIHNSQKYYPLYSQREFTHNNIKQGNRNVLLYSDNTVDGLKTGHTKDAGFCLAASSKRGNMRLISVILGTKSAQERGLQSRELLDWGFGHFTTKIAAPANQTVGSVEVKYGKADAVSVVTQNNLQVLLAKVDEDKIQTVINLNPNVEAPIQAGQPLGKMTAVLHGKPVATVNLVAQSAVEPSGFFARMWQQMKGFFQGLFA